MSTNKILPVHLELESDLKCLGLKTFIDNYQSVAQQCDKKGHTNVRYLQELCLYEVEKRNQNRLERLLKEAKLPRNKLLVDFDIGRIPGLSPALIERLASGEFMDRTENILIFGNPGTGKSHLSIALARQWCLLGHHVLFTTASKLVQELRSAQMHNQLHTLIKKLARIECLLIDDISYVQMQREDTDCLFQLLSERYEQSSTLITSNIMFSQWKSIFKDEMTTAAVIDRLIHHCEILELNAPSYRTQKAVQKKAALATCIQGESHVTI